MANAVAADCCGLCQMDFGHHAELVMCAQGHAFHKKCVVVPPHIRANCPVESCGEPFTSYEKSLGNRLAESFIIEIGWSDSYRQAVRELANELGISYEYASAVLTETDFLKLCLEAIPETFLELLSSRSFLLLVGAIIALYGLPILSDYFQQQFYPGDSVANEETEVVISIQ
ncbi:MULTISPECIES: hypothetical protein [Gammaproteobacteria]|uniref:hypothetical protein n=1 Tax=Gammaproteobacteria TaxID=1236 RepID=UPI001ADAC45F|nr:MULTISPECIES: hypothetical protein [Gammaproteobacteria]MBO9481289.1 hypothetical protein [Salinisphaera sp. G21_0]MBO9496530.1 hypothetical protein [Thalassotalea sp. G20_0]